MLGIETSASCMLGKLCYEATPCAQGTRRWGEPRVDLSGEGSHCLRASSAPPLGCHSATYLLVGLKMKKELASGIGTAFSFSCSSARGRGRGLTGISGSSSSSSPVGRGNEIRVFPNLARSLASVLRVLPGASEAAKHRPVWGISKVCLGLPLLVYRVQYSSEVPQTFCK